MGRMGRKPAIVNLTPHPVHFRGADGAILYSLPPSGTVAHLAETVTPTDEVLEIGGADVPVDERSYGIIEGLPEPEIYDSLPARLYVVPLLTALAAKAAGRDMADIRIAGDLTRNGEGTYNGCRTLARLA